LILLLESYPHALAPVGHDVHD